MIAEIGRIVEKACAQDTNIFGYGIWTHHITQVVKHGKRLAPLFKADQEIVELAALLHDYANVKDGASYCDHHIRGAREAELLLLRFGYPIHKIAAVKHCIEGHRATAPGELRSAEAECLANADAVAHIENMPSLLHLAFVQHRLGIDEGAQWVRAKLERSWKKVSPSVQEMVRQKYKAALLVLTATTAAA